MTIQLRDIADRLDQTTIRLAIDLARVRRLTPGEEIQFLADIDCEVYVVQRTDPEHSIVHALTISADTVTVRAENA